MKRALILLLLFLLPASLLQAQTAVTLQSLEVELWPDYDREAVLVLLTGQLPAGTPLPATLTLPLPDGADFNVVARITPENVMTDQGITPLLSANQVTFTTPDSRFRVEYYQPYSAEANERDFAFSWQSDLTIEQFSVTVQQPIAAGNLTTIPAAASVSAGQDGLTYHVLPVQGLAPGDTYRVEVAYTMNTPQLTVDFSSGSSGAEAAPILDAVPVTSSETNWQVWLIALGVLILVATAVWFGFNRRVATRRRPARPKPQRPAKRRQAAAGGSHPSAKANFCHQCGQALQAEDKFCRSCGTAVKGT